MQPGDVPITYADTTPLEEDFGFRPSTPLRDGLRAFAQWYAKYYGTSKQIIKQKKTMEKNESIECEEPCEGRLSRTVL